ncbi:OmpA family protein [Pseudoleptotrichia goodfellowii]|uniref:OmpA-like domain-containing protein n=1 Tax=Pseudoleptotrichia goodfellowii TaxID=157692 RepID=A0A510J7P1_9FUSO|nr:hypothetical protein JCM16774_0145 [Pseudoleptotrichia goodfellowii]
MRNLLLLHNLKDFFKILRLKNIITVEIIGHTDSEEKDKDRLSLKRAENFYKFLRENGLDESIILDKISAKGDKEPADTNKLYRDDITTEEYRLFLKVFFLIINKNCLKLIIFYHFIFKTAFYISHFLFLLNYTIFFCTFI